MNVFLFMSKAREPAGMAATQAEREYEGPPWSGTVDVRFFGFLRQNPYLSTYSFDEHTKTCRALSRATTTVWKQTQPQALCPELSSLTPKDKDNVRTSRTDKVHANGSCHDHHVGTPTVSTPFLTLGLSTMTNQRLPPKQPYFPHMRTTGHRLLVPPPSLHPDAKPTC